MEPSWLDLQVFEVRGSESEDVRTSYDLQLQNR